MRDYKILKKIGLKIKELRRKNDFSQEDLAEKVGVHRNHISRIEQGEINIPFYTFYRIVKALKVRSSEILPF